VWRSGRITDMECTKVVEHYETPTFIPEPPHWNRSAKNSVGPAQPPSHRYQTFPLLFAQIGYGRLCGLWVWRRRSNHWQCCLPMSTPSTSPWIAQTDVSGRWDNRLAAQHLNLVRLKRWIKDLAQTMMIMKQLVLAYCKHSHLNQHGCAVFTCVE